MDATRGLRDCADDLAATIEALGLAAVHLVGWSMGGGVVLQYLADRPGTHRVESLTLVDPVSPCRCGGTRGLDGALCDPSVAPGDRGVLNTIEISARGLPPLGGRGIALPVRSRNVPARECHLGPL